MRGKTLFPMASMLFMLMALVLFAGTKSTQGEPEKLTDSAVKTVLEQRLIKYGLLRDNNIQVSVDNGVITLNGVVRSLAEKEKVAHYAHEVDDTYAIENLLTIQAGNLSDQQIADSVMAQVDKYVFYSIFDWIEVQVNNGVATLSGWVDAPWHKSGYEKQAKKAVGVRQIKNEIETLPASFTDDQVRREAAGVIYDDPILDRYGYRAVPAIHIIVNMGIVTLKGVVASSFDANRAGSLVRYRTDAFDVVNQLQFPSE
jgi:osmotically-inducible protein OsmY